MTPSALLLLALLSSGASAQDADIAARGRDYAARQCAPQPLSSECRQVLDFIQVDGGMPSQQTIMAGGEEYNIGRGPDWYSKVRFAMQPCVCDLKPYITDWDAYSAAEDRAEYLGNPELYLERRYGDQSAMEKLCNYSKLPLSEQVLPDDPQLRSLGGPFWVFANMTKLGLGTDVSCYLWAYNSTGEVPSTLDMISLAASVIPGARGAKNGWKGGMKMTAAGGRILATNYKKIAMSQKAAQIVSDLAKASGPERKSLSQKLAQKGVEMMKDAQQFRRAGDKAGADELEKLGREVFSLSTAKVLPRP